MTLDTIEVTRGRTGDPVLRPGQYAAIGCCCMTKALKQGDLFPACPAHGRSTEWERVPPGAVVGPAAVSLPPPRG
jgi:hypothetical protein